MAGAGGRAVTNVSADDLGAVIKILSRWEVRRGDFNDTPARPRSSRLLRCLGPVFSGGRASRRRKGLSGRGGGVQASRGGTERTWQGPGGFPSGDKGRKEQGAATFVSSLPLLGTAEDLGVGVGHRPL